MGSRVSVFVVGCFGLILFACSDTTDSTGKVDSGTDAAVLMDAARLDAALDLSADVTASDAPVADAGASDAVIADTGVTDAAMDVGASDAGVEADAGLLDLGTVSGECFLPTPYRMYPTTPWLVYLDALPIATVAGLSDLQKEQLIIAVHQSAHTDVTTAEEALARVEDLLLERFWDDSNAKSVDVYTYYSGDNRYGGAFEGGSTTLLAAIMDGDTYGCTRSRGGIHRECASTATCLSGESCTGIYAGVGRCAESAPVLGSGETCTTSNDCAIDFGLVCASYAGATSGTCLQAWMQTVVPQNVGAVPVGGESVFTLHVSGIATVDIAVSLGVYAPGHPRPTDLRFVVTNPDGSESSATVTDYAQVRGLITEELRLTYSGDERVNGEWTVHVYDDGTGEPADVDMVWLRIKSRLD